MPLPSLRPATHAPRPVRSAMRRAVALAGLVLGACSSDDPVTVTPPLTGTIAISLTPASISVAAGAQGSLGIGITRGGGFDGPVTLSASGTPPGVTVQFTSPIVSAGAFSTAATVTVAAGTAARTAQVAIAGSGGGITSPVATLTVRVP